MNLGWVCKEQRQFLASHTHYLQAVQRADQAQNDVLRATSRAELAGSMVMGSGVNAPTVNVEDVQKLVAEFDKQCKNLDRWHMKTFALGESAMWGGLSAIFGRQQEQDRNGSNTQLG